MSIFLRGVDMPECCCGCPCCYEKADGSCFCTAAKDGEPCDIENLDQRLPNCPAEDVPEPHGRLIDADELKKQIDDFWYNEYRYQDTNYSTAAYLSKNVVNKMLTIIKAEG